MVRMRRAMGMGMGPLAITRRCDMWIEELTGCDRWTIIAVMTICLAFVGIGIGVIMAVLMIGGNT